ncbi:hypothetical protein [Parabacteroides caecihominis]|uniref:hypothetical protein n=1 Tax=Parabacteroides sp. TA-V-105 TaxID=2949651 RepID=UPI00202F08CA|nr:hypothetical protein [Parabacteroides sp. TA-V-105]MCM0714306.1 hypothetical protein [Parabacteroides sp. TA-V-105]
MDVVQFDAFDHQVARLGIVLDVEAGNDAFEIDCAFSHGAADIYFVIVTLDRSGCSFLDLYRVDRRHDQRAGQLAGGGQEVRFHFEELGFGGFAQFQFVQVVLPDGVGDEIDFLLSQPAQLDLGDFVGRVDSQVTATHLELFGKDGLCGVVRGVGMLVEDIDREAVEGGFGNRSRQLIQRVGVRLAQGDASTGKVFQREAEGRLA